MTDARNPIAATVNHMVGEITKGSLTPLERTNMLSTFLAKVYAALKVNLEIKEKEYISAQQDMDGFNAIFKVYMEQGHFEEVKFSVLDGGDELDLP